MKFPASLSVVLQPVEDSENSPYLARCLDYHMVVQGDGPANAANCFLEHLVQTEALVDEHGARDPFEYLGAGPKEVHDLWSTSTAKPDRVEGKTVVYFKIVETCTTYGACEEPVSEEPVR